MYGFPCQHPAMEELNGAVTEEYRAENNYLVQDYFISKTEKKADKMCSDFCK